MTHLFTAHFVIRQYELNAHNDLPNSTLARFFQETAMRGSADAGFGVEWYATQASVWVVHALIIERVRPVRYGDDLAITTWVSDFRRVRSHREYLARNARTGAIVGRGRADWVHLNRNTMTPARVPAALVARFDPNGIRAIHRPQPRAYPSPRIALPEVSVTRRVQRYEADGLHHVNHAVYIDWLEEALQEAVAMRWDEARRLCVYRHDLEYVRSALPGDSVRITVRCVGMGKTASAWHLEIKRGDELLVRDHLTALWVNEHGKPVRW